MPHYIVCQQGNFIHYFYKGYQDKRVLLNNDPDHAKRFTTYLRAEIACKKCNGITAVEKLFHVFMSTEQPYVYVPFYQHPKFRENAKGKAGY